MSSQPSIVYHLDAQLFRSAIQFTSTTTGFSERLIEKDYFCSVALHDLCSSNTFGLVFKGGTCLSKVHAEFYRMSEDLDFSVSMPITSSRSERSRSLTKVKKHLADLPTRHACFQIDEPLAGFNNSTQYGGRIAYTSVVTGQDDFVKIEISIREPIIEPAIRLAARTMLRDPFRNVPAVADFQTPVLSLREAYAEKLRAALTRDEPAIRDFFDVDHAILTMRLDVTDPELIQLLKAKLSIPGNEAVDITPEKLRRLRSQVATQLRPVLRAEDFIGFDLDRAFVHVAQVAQMAGV